MFSLMFFGMLGWAMKHFRWPRPPFVLGFILGDVIERYMFISIERYGVSWMLRPVVVVMFIMAGLSLLRPLLQDIRSHGGLKKMVSQWGHPHVFDQQSVPGRAALPVRRDAVAIFRMGVRRPHHSDHRRHRRDPVLLAEPDQRRVRPARAQRRRRRRAARSAENPHGHRVQDRAPARQGHPHPRIFVLRLDGRLRRLHGADRAHSDRADLHHSLHARRRPRAVEDRDPDGGQSWCC